jgi:hypothetical protein
MSVRDKEGLITTNSSEWGDSDDGVDQGESKVMILKAGNLKVFFFAINSTIFFSIFYHNDGRLVLTLLTKNNRPNIFLKLTIDEAALGGSTR